MIGMIPAVYIDFVGTLVGTYDFKRHLEEAIRSTRVDPKKCREPEKLAELDREYTRRVLADSASRLRTGKTVEALKALERRGFWRVVWTSEDAYTVGEVLKRDGVRVDRIDSTIGYCKPAPASVEYVYEPFEDKITKAELLRRTEYAPTIVVDDDPKGLEHCKLSGRSDIEIFLGVLENPRDAEEQKPFKDKRVELGLDVKLLFSRTIEDLPGIARKIGR